MHFLSHRCSPGSCFVFPLTSRARPPQIRPYDPFYPPPPIAKACLLNFCKLLLPDSSLCPPPLSPDFAPPQNCTNTLPVLFPGPLFCRYFLEISLPKTNRTFLAIISAGYLSLSPFMSYPKAASATSFPPSLFSPNHFFESPVLSYSRTFSL